MNNEEKILEVLTGMASTQEGILSRLDKLEATQAQQGTQITKQGILIEQLIKTQVQYELKQMELDTTLNSLKKDVEKLNERSLRSAVILENDVARDIRLVYEGQKNLLDTMTPQKDFKELEELVQDKLVVLESVVKSHSERLAALEKAQ